MMFPGDKWSYCSMEAQGFTPSTLHEIDALMQTSEANGVLLRDGNIVAEWSHGGPMDQEFNSMSIGKSFTSLVLGLALDERLIPNLDTNVKDIYPEFNAGPFTEEITFRHLVTMTAGIKSSRHNINYTKLLPPETAMIYHADQPAHLARVLTYVYCQELIDVLKERILIPIGSTARWGIDEPPWSPIIAKDGKEYPVNTGYGVMYWTVHDLARVGLLFANYGEWQRRELISINYVNQCWTEIHQKDLRPGHWGGGYGLYWWRLVEGVWYMSGWGGQFCMVWPEAKVVMVKLNECTNDHTLLEGKKNVDLQKIFPLVYHALTRKEFPIPKAWKVSWLARGHGDTNWWIPSD